MAMASSTAANEVSVPPATRGTGWPLRRYLLAMVLAVLLPLLTFAGVLLWHDVTRQYAIH